MSMTKGFVHLVKLISLFTLTLIGVQPVFAQEPSTPVFAGYRDFSYESGSVTNEPTQEKPESKLWHNDGVWWATMWDNAGHGYRIYRLDLPTQTWINVGPDVDERGRSSQDVLWDAARQKLYIVSHAKLSIQAGISEKAKLYRYSYDASNDTYSLDSGFPVIVGEQKTRAMTIAMDSTGKLWIAWTAERKVMVDRSSGGDRIWNLDPFVLPVQGNDLELNDDGETIDVCAIISFGGNQIGILWGNQESTDEKIYFAVHRDGDADTDWQPRETAFGDSTLNNAADDHLNLTETADGTILAAAKHETNNRNLRLVSALKRTPSGEWSNSIFGLRADNHTRLCTLLDADTDSLYVFARSDEPTSGPTKTIFYKAAHVNNLVFPPGFGRIFLRSALDANISNPTSTKQAVNAATGLVVLASNNNTHYYVHNYLALGGNSTPVARDDAASTEVNLPVEIKVVENDNDADGAIDLATLTIVTAPVYGHVAVNNATGIITYTPDEDFRGIDDFIYTLKDNNGESAVGATVTVRVGDVPAGVEEEPSHSGRPPQRFTLFQNFPNPFNPQTEIKFDLLQSGLTVLKVYNLIGEEITTLVNRSLPAGSHRVTFDAATLPTGVYVYKLENTGLSETRKMVLLR